MNENVIVRKTKVDKPLLQNDSIIDKCIRDCHDEYFPTSGHICEYNLNFTHITNNETVKFKISDRSMGLFDSNKKLTVA